jgi:dTDP-4-amino-4,6-dideoxygalactose transaminase
VTSHRQPAILGGVPSFPDGLPLVRPTLRDTTELSRRLDQILQSGILTNGRVVRELEEAVSERLGVPHVVAVANCTAGLMLTLQALGVDGRVVLPSFTFAASAHAVVWAGGTPVWAEIDSERLTLDPADADSLVDGAVAMTATHVYGAPCQVEALQAVADQAGIPLIYDSAHALGSTRRGTPVGRFGTAEVFSLSPTKVTVAGEGGLVATADPGLADALRIGRDYGNPGNYDCQFAGLNARLSELHAAVALHSLNGLDERIVYRNELVGLFKAAVADVAGVTFQLVDREDVSTYKDLTLIIDREIFGLDVPQLATALRSEGIDSRRYYSPAIHQQKAYSHLPRERDLPVTESVAERVLTLPLWSHMTHGQVSAVADAVINVARCADQIRTAAL